MAKEATESQVWHANREFLPNLCDLLTATIPTESNLIFSPLAIHLVLSIIYQGVNGELADRLRDVLRVPNPTVAAKGYYHILKHLLTDSNVITFLPSKVFLSETLDPREDFKQHIGRFFSTDIQNLSLDKKTSAITVMNEWVKRQTKGTIREVLRMAELTGNIEVVVACVFYMKISWQEKFDVHSTKVEPFHCLTPENTTSDPSADAFNHTQASSQSETYSVEMMHTRRKLFYNNDSNLDAQIIELPFLNRDKGMIVFLPNNQSHIGALEAAIKKGDLVQVLEGMWSVDVEVSLPKFQVEQSINLNALLGTLELGALLDPESDVDLSGMFDGKKNETNPRIGIIVHRAMIEVDEEGAAGGGRGGVGGGASEKQSHGASSGVSGGRGFGMRGSSTNANIAIFKADHPFIFVIYERSVTDNAHNVVCFGRITKPTIVG